MPADACIDPTAAPRHQIVVVVDEPYCERYQKWHLMQRSLSGGAAKYPVYEILCSRHAVPFKPSRTTRDAIDAIDRPPVAPGHITPRSPPQSQMLRSRETPSGLLHPISFLSGRTVQVGFPMRLSGHLRSICGPQTVAIPGRRQTRRCVCHREHLPARPLSSTVAAYFRLFRLMPESCRFRADTMLDFRT